MAWRRFPELCAGSGGPPRHRGSDDFGADPDCGAGAGHQGTDRAREIQSVTWFGWIVFVSDLSRRLATLQRGKCNFGFESAYGSVSLSSSCSCSCIRPSGRNCEAKLPLIQLSEFPDPYMDAPQFATNFLMLTIHNRSQPYIRPVFAEQLAGREPPY